jgi:magnesium chelatase family protein
MNYNDLRTQQTPETSQIIRQRIDIARKIQLERYQGQNIYSNSQLTPKLLKKYCKLDTKEQSLLEEAFIK